MTNMTREIKFRAWNNKIKQMYCGQFPLSCLDTLLNGENKEEWSVMEYTGLKDKNGKEIYEGDIVVWNGTNHQIYWNDEATPHWSGLPDSRVPYVLNRDCEIIGNIYEHPNLINN